MRNFDSRWHCLLSVGSATTLKNKKMIDTEAGKKSLHHNRRVFEANHSKQKLMLQNFGLDFFCKGYM